MTKKLKTKNGVMPAAYSFVTGVYLCVSAVLGEVASELHDPVVHLELVATHMHLYTHNTSSTHTLYSNVAGSNCFINV